MTAPTNNASFYASFAELNSLKREAKTQSKESLRAAAQQFESLFTQMMLKSMREATKSVGDSLTGSNDVDFYQGMYDQQLASQLSKGKGLGLADMLVQQLTRSGLVQSKPVAPNSSHETAAPVQSTPASTTGTEKISSTSVTSASSRDEFVKQLWPQAEKAAQALGVAPSTLIAHAALETGWGKNIPCNADGSSSFNLFGIKATARWSGAANDSRTTEYEGGAAVSRVEKFKSYSSAAECFDDYAALLKNAPRYSGAQNTGADSGRFAEALQKGGYATDPHYADKLQAVASSLKSWIERATANSSFADGGRNNGRGVS